MSKLVEFAKKMERERKKEPKKIIVNKAEEKRSFLKKYKKSFEKKTDLKKTIREFVINCELISFYPFTLIGSYVASLKADEYKHYVEYMEFITGEKINITPIFTAGLTSTFIMLISAFLSYYLLKNIFLLILFLGLGLSIYKYFIEFLPELYKKRRRDLLFYAPSNLMTALMAESVYELADVLSKKEQGPISQDVRQAIRREHLHIEDLREGLKRLFKNHPVRTLRILVNVIENLDKKSKIDLDIPITEEIIAEMKKDSADMSVRREAFTYLFLLPVLVLFILSIKELYASPLILLSIPLFYFFADFAKKSITRGALEIFTLKPLPKYYNPHREKILRYQWIFAFPVLIIIFLALYFFNASPPLILIGSVSGYGLTVFFLPTLIEVYEKETITKTHERIFSEYANFLRLLSENLRNYNGRVAFEIATRDYKGSLKRVFEKANATLVLRGSLKQVFSMLNKDIDYPPLEGFVHQTRLLLEKGDKKARESLLKTADMLDKIESIFDSIRAQTYEQNVHAKFMGILGCPLMFGFFPKLAEMISKSIGGVQKTIQMFGDLESTSIYNWGAVPDTSYLFFTVLCWTVIASYKLSDEERFKNVVIAVCVFLFVYSVSMSL